MPTVTLTSSRLGLTHAVVGGRRIRLNAPVELDDATIKKAWSLPGMRVEGEDGTLFFSSSQSGGEAPAAPKGRRSRRAKPSEGSNDDDNPGNDGESGEPGFAGGDAPPAPPATT